MQLIIIVFLFSGRVLMKTLLNFYLSIPLSLLLSACSSYSFNSNLNKENFEHYFAVSNVDYYQTDQLAKFHVEQLGMVEAEDCQSLVNQPPAEKQQAMISAKRQAAKLGANGIIIDACIAPPRSKQCISSYICYASAIKVSPLTPEVK